MDIELCSLICRFWDWCRDFFFRNIFYKPTKIQHMVSWVFVFREHFISNTLWWCAFKSNNKIPKSDHNDIYKNMCKTMYRTCAEHVQNMQSMQSMWCMFRIHVSAIHTCILFWDTYQKVCLSSSEIISAHSPINKLLWIYWYWCGTERPQVTATTPFCRTTLYNVAWS